MKDMAIETGDLGNGVEYWIVPNSIMQEQASSKLFAESYNKLAGLNGYIIFPKRPLKELGYDGIVVYVPVHGGITFAAQLDEGFVYGFDTAHHNSEDFPRMDPVWIKEQCLIMLMGILRAQEVEKKYLKCTTSNGRIKHIQRVTEVGNMPGLQVGADKSEVSIGALSNILSGEL